MRAKFNPHSAKRDYSRFESVFLEGQITVIGNEICVQKSRFENVRSEIKQIWVIYNYVKLWVTVMIQNCKWVKILIN